MKKHKRLIRLLFRTAALVLIFGIASLIFVRLTAKADSLIGFNEGYGSTVHDTEGSASGTIYNAVWKPESECLSGSCIYFDGTGDYVSFGDESTYDFAAATNWTIDFWFRTTDITSGTRVMVGKYRGDDAEGGYKIYISSDGKVNFGVDDDNSWGPDDIATSINAYDDNLWHHLEAVKSGTTSLTLYVDAVRVGSDPSIQATGSLVNDDDFTLGMDSYGSTNPYTGFLDELKVHVTTARTAEQVKLDYQKNSTTTGASARFGPDTSFLSQGLVGYWKMDETASWSGTLNEVIDSSGNSNHGQAQGATGGKAYQGSGKFGKGGYFDGTDDYVNAGNSSSMDLTTDFTLSAWINPGSFLTTQHFISKGYAYYLRTWGGPSNGKIEIGVRVGGQDKFSQTSSYLLNSNTWSHVVATYSTRDPQQVIHLFFNGSEVGYSQQDNLGGSAIDTTEENFLIGKRIDGWIFSGGIDDVRVYNRALSPNEVQKLYNWAPGPVGWWKLDEETGLTAYDSSGNGNSGTLSSSNATWAAGVNGNGVHLNWYGYINIPDSDYLSPATYHQFSAFEWVKFDTIQYGARYISKTSGGDAYEWYMDIQSNGNYRVLLTDSSGGNNYMSYNRSSLGIQADTWYHVGFTFDDSLPSLKLYLNGVKVAEDNTGDPNYPIVNGTAPLRIGCDVGQINMMSGYIDDIRIYNYARTPSQVVEDMNAGHPAPGSPVGSAVAHWKMDEGYGTTAYDSSENALNLTLSSASWTNNGKFGKAWNGNGARRLYITDNYKLDFTATGSATFTTWIKSDTAGNPSGDEYIISKASSPTAPGYGLYFNNAGKPVFAADDDTTWTPDFLVVGTTDIYDGTWHQITAVKTQGSRFELYIDGNLNASSAVSIPDGDLNNANNFYVGDRNGSDDGNEFNGDIDEVQVFRGALTSDQVKLLYNQGFSASMGVLSTASSSATMTSAARSYCPPGDTGTCNPPVGEWKLDENTSTTAYDSGGNSNTGTLTGGTAWTSGKFGSGLNFDGTDDYVTVADNSVLDFGASDNFTISSWFKRPAPSGQVLEINHESGDFSSYTTTVTDSGDLSISASAALDNTNYGLSVNVDDTTAIYAAKSGMADSSGAVRVRFMLDPNTLTMAEGNTFSILRLITSGGTSVAEIYLYYTAAVGYQLQSAIQHDSGWNYSGFKWISDQPHIVEVYLKRATTDSSNNGYFKVWIDQNGSTGLDLVSYDNYSTFSNWGEIRFGAVAYLDAGTSGTFYFDEIAVNDNGNYFEPYIEGNFENNSLSREFIAYNTDGGDLSISSAAAMGGSSYGLSLNVDDTNVIDGYFYHDYRASTNKVRIRYYIDPNSITMANNDEFLYFSPAPSSWEWLIYGYLGYTTSGGYYLAMDIKNDALTFQLGSHVNISDGPHYIEVYLQRASTSSSNDGSISWWIDGVAQTGVTGVDNYDVFSDYQITRFGAIAYIDPGTSGTFYLDEIYGNNDGTTATPPQEVLTNKFEPTGSDGGYQIQMQPDGDITFGVGDSNTTFPKDMIITTSGTYDDGNWHYLTAIKNGTSSLKLYVDGVLVGTDSSIAASGTLANNDPLYLGISGDASTKSWSGSLDDIRVYNYARTPAQIAWDYNRGKPVGWWKFDEGSGDTANNSSEVGSAINGNLAGSGGSCPGAAACPAWSTSGKLNSALNFDGSNDYVEISSTNTLWYSTRPGSISFWTKLDGYAVSDYPVSINLKSDLTNGFSIWYTDDTNYAGIDFGDGGSYYLKRRTAGDISASLVGTWRHVVLIYDGVSCTSASSYKLYLDTKLQETVAVTSGVSASPANNYIGSSDLGANHWFDGLIDDVRVYNYNLTPEQIGIVYNEGAVRFAPVTGTP